MAMLADAGISLDAAEGSAAGRGHLWRSRPASLQRHRSARGAGAVADGGRRWCADWATVLRPTTCEDYGLPLLHFALVHERGELPPVELHWRVHWYERSFARERLLPPAVDPLDDWRPAPADELAALLLFYARDGFVDLRLATDLGAWWDVYGAELPPGALDELLHSYPAFAHAIPVALRVAERLVGLPAARSSGTCPSWAFAIAWRCAREPQPALQSVAALCRHGVDRWTADPTGRASPRSCGDRCCHHMRSWTSRLGTRRGNGPDLPWSWRRHHGPVWADDDSPGARSRNAGSDQITNGCDLWRSIKERSRQGTAARVLLAT